MKSYIAPHDVIDQVKFDGLVEAYRTGQSVTPVVVFEDQALTGSHRIAAYDAACRAWERGDDGCTVQPELDTVEVDEADFFAALEKLGYSRDDAWHLSGPLCNVAPNDLCEALYSVTDDGALKSALDDQRGE